MGARLSVNVDAARGALHAEVLREDGRVVAKSAAITGDRPNTPVRWERGDIAGLIGRTVSLRFRLRDARLYSYWTE